MKSIVILAGGGPAPGINTVIGTITKVFISNGYQVIGLHGGYSGLFSKNPNYEILDFKRADSIFNRGGSYLTMSRFKPTNEDFEKNFNADFFKENDIKLLVTVGGDDTASTANRIAKFLEANHYPIQNIHVPKTIDNDLPLPHEQPTFGFNSAKQEGTRIATTVYEDARTSATWYVICAMGRSAGHLALGIGEACHYPMIVIPEMFNKTNVSVEKIVNMAISAIIKRNILGIPYGGIMISEGVFHILEDEDLKNCGVTFSYDEHGHPELGKVSKAQVFSTLLENKLKELKLKVKIRPVEIGYDVRCVNPCSYDISYCSQLAWGVWTLFDKKETGCMVHIDENGCAAPLYLKDLQDSVTGKINPRLVNIDGGKVKSIFKNCLHYVTAGDYEAASKYVSNPADFDFCKILNWDMND